MAVYTGIMKSKLTTIYVVRLTGEEVTMIVAALVRFGAKKLANKILRSLTK